MPFSMNIHGDPFKPGSLEFSAKRVRQGDNANAAGLVFSNKSVRNDAAEITLFNLSDTDADILCGVGLLGDADRKSVAALVNELLSKQGE